jgi:polyhydroxyalkanoate synthesis repressor PhaR
MVDPTPIRLIRRYANRKLYDVEQSRYIKLDEIGELVRAGINVRVEDKKTGEDLTARTLTHLLHQEEKRLAAGTPARLVKQWMQSSGDLLQRHVTEPVTRAREEAERTVATLREDVERGVDRLRQREREGAEAVKTGLRELVETSHQRLEEAQVRFDEKVRLLVATLPLIHAQRDELTELRRRVETLEALLLERTEIKSREEPQKDK